MKPPNLFQHAKIGQFFQPQPKLGNVYLGDGFLQRLLQKLLPPNIHKEIHADLIRLGSRVENEIDELGFECELNQPYLQQYDSWGKRVDQLVTCAAWKRMKTISVEERIISSGYDGKYSEFSRIYQFAKCFIFHPSSGLYSCPLAMTDGAAKTIKALNLTKLDPIYQRLTSNIPDEFYTSGQWMTERKGGSDVANGTETIAVQQSNGKYLLYGYKWFSSATDADVTFTLARIVDSDGQTISNKLGTKSLPTAELLLDGCEAELISQPGRGISSISSMLTMTRIHNTVGTVAGMRRMLLLARDYSTKRQCFGSPVYKFPLHLDTMADMELQVRGGTVLAFELVRLLGLVETNPSQTEEESLILRVLTPVAKLYTAKKAMELASEGLECFGGQGYIEDTGLPAILRNLQVGTIWEGTTNVLSLDMLRAIATTKGQALLALQENLGRRLKSISTMATAADGIPGMNEAVEILSQEMEELQKILLSLNVEEATARARLLSFSIAEISIGTLLLEHAVHTKVSSDLTTGIKWVQKMNKIQNKFKNLDPVTSQSSYNLVFDGFYNFEDGLIDSNFVQAKL